MNVLGVSPDTDRQPIQTKKAMHMAGSFDRCHQYLEAERHARHSVNDASLGFGAQAIDERAQVRRRCCLVNGEIGVMAEQL